MGATITLHQLTKSLASFIERNNLTEEFLNEMEDLDYDREDVEQDLENLKE